MKTTITKVLIRKCVADSLRRGRYTTGEVDPDIVQIVAEISAGEVSGYGGFVTVPHFYRFFKRATESSPMEFRRRGIAELSSIFSDYDNQLKIITSWGCRSINPE